jgi:hypothetical protein
LLDWLAFRSEGLDGGLRSKYLLRQNQFAVFGDARRLYSSFWCTLTISLLPWNKWSLSMRGFLSDEADMLRMTVRLVAKSQTSLPLGA